MLWWTQSITYIPIFYISAIPPQPLLIQCFQPGVKIQHVHHCNTSHLQVPSTQTKTRPFETTPSFETTQTFETSQTFETTTTFETTPAFETTQSLDTTSALTSKTIPASETTTASETSSSSAPFSSAYLAESSTRPQTVSPFTSKPSKSSSSIPANTISTLSAARSTTQTTMDLLPRNQSHTRTTNKPGTRIHHTRSPTGATISEFENTKEEGTAQLSPRTTQSQLVTTNPTTG